MWGARWPGRSVFEHRARWCRHASREQRLPAGWARGRRASAGTAVESSQGQWSKTVFLGRARSIRIWATEVVRRVARVCAGIRAVADSWTGICDLPRARVVGVPMRICRRHELLSPALFAVEVASFAVLRDWCASGLRHGSLRWKLAAARQCVDGGGRGDTSGGAETGRLMQALPAERCDGGGGCQ